MGRVDGGIGHSRTTGKVGHVTRVRHRAGTTTVAIVTGVGSAPCSVVTPTEDVVVGFNLLPESTKFLSNSRLNFL